MSTRHATEIWRKIPGEPGYEVSTEGRIRSFWRRRGGKRRAEFYVSDTPRILKPFKDRNGYPHVDLATGGNRKGRRKSRTLARLVLLAFVGPPGEGEMALHVDNPDKGDCRLANLRWGRRSENNGADIVRHRGKHPCSPLTPDDVREIRRLLARGLTQTEVAGRFGVSPSTVHLIARGKHHQYVK
jgi:hypothetical protein